MKFQLQMYMNPTTWESLSEDDQNAVFQGHDEFVKLTTESGEFVATRALGEPATSTVVRVRDGAPASTDGPYAQAEEFLCGYYVVDVENKERALELAAKIPDAKHTGIEVRPIVYENVGDK